jgi:hypothetical protein
LNTKRPILFSNHKPLDQPGTSLCNGDVECVRRYTAVFFILISLAVPFTGAVVPADMRQAGPVVTGTELNVTGNDIANQTFPSRYEIQPTLVRVEVKVSDTLLPGPKGEMAAGPRTIGFSVDPLSLLLLVIAIVTASAGVWYLVKKKPAEAEEDNEKNVE